MKIGKTWALMCYLLIVIAFSVQTAVASTSALENRQQTENLLFTQFQEWARTGDTAAFAQYILKIKQVRSQASHRCETGDVLVSHVQTASPVCVSSQLLLRTDSFGNNLLHSAKEISTVGAVGSLFRIFSSEGFIYINKLKDKKNSALETPLVAHINRGDLSSFDQLYEGSSLERAIKAYTNTRQDPANLLFFSSNGIWQEEILKWGTNAAGTNILSLVEQQPDSPQRTKILRFLMKNAPSLL
ncbi:MAG: hypothetical protein J5601_00640 [Elusimicrobiaceae bacterium]|nr:hypothetical protein [Elusimicrobiaceae bacterium]